MSAGKPIYLVDEYGNVHYLADELARGGQGVVYRTSDDDLAIKQPLDANGQPDKNVDLRKTFQKIRTLELPKGIPLSLPLAILRDEPGYVMRLLNGMRSFSGFSLDGEQRIEKEKNELPQWLGGISDKRFAQDLAYYAETGSTCRRLYALFKCASILARLHNAGIVYGDISQNNVFISKNIPGECWLIDADNLRLEIPFGGRTVFTPHLGAPEIVQGKDSSRPRTDCWAFSVMAFQMLALCHPFIGKKVLEPNNNCGWDSETPPEDIPVDLDEQAYAGYFPYIDDEEDDSNEFQGGLPRQLVLTQPLCRLFQETFGAGRLQPHRRPSMTFWAVELAKAFDNSVLCPNCRMSYYFMADTAMCPYCQTLRPGLVIAKTPHWSKILTAQVAMLTGNNQNGATMGDTDEMTSFVIDLPHRLFNAFSLTSADLTAYSALIDLKNKTVTPPRGAKPLPSDLAFEFVIPEALKHETSPQGALQ